MSLYQRLRRQAEGQAVEADERREPPHAQLKLEIQRKLAESLPVQSGHLTLEAEEELRGKIRELLAEEDLSMAERDALLDELVQGILGLGPLQPLLDDPDVSEIMVNGKDEVYVEVHGRIRRTAVRFASDREIVELIDRIVAPLGRRIDESSPMVDARLKDGSRVNAIIPPLALKGPCLTIRKFPAHPLGIDDLIRNRTLDERVALFLRAAVRARLNIVVSGGTASGKTTLLNCLSSFIPAEERIITIEDAAELRLQQEHVVTLETRPPNLEGRGEITVRHLVRNALRMRPDRIVVGEVRSGEALDMLQAMNTGHDGSLTTIHANGPREVLSRLETMVLMAGVELPLRAIREQIASAVDLIIQVSRLKSGERKVTHVTEVQGMEGDVIVLQDLFRLTPEGDIQPTGLRPRAFERLREADPTLPLEAFAGGRL
jgi:pilus assembly protein CpaF